MPLTASLATHPDVVSRAPDVLDQLSAAGVDVELVQDAGSGGESADPLRDVVFIVRAGALFPIYRTSSLLEQLKGKVHVPAVLFYPGELDGAAGLRFMGVLDAEHNYRPKIF